MKNALRTFVSLFLALVLVLAVGAITPSDAEVFGAFTYKIVDGEAVITDCSNKDAEAIVIPQTLGGYPVAEIGKAVFKEGQLKSITLPSGLKRIDEEAFAYCAKLEAIVIPDSVVSIGRRAFSGCLELQSAVMPKDMEEVQAELFMQCEKLTSVTLPVKLNAVGESMFDGCLALSEITLPESVELIDNSAFFNCRSLKSIKLPSGLKAIGYEAFRASGLEEIDFPNGLETIDFGVFYECTKPKTISIGTGKLTAEDGAFACLSGLEEIKLAEGSVNLYLSDGALIDSTDGTLLLYPAKRADDNCVIPEGVKTISEAAFWCSTELAKVSFPQSLELFSQNAFYGCSKLTSLTFPMNVKKLGYSAFEECPALTELYFEGPRPEVEYPAFREDGTITVYYHKDYAESWTPNGETGWGENPMKPYGYAPDEYYYELNEDWMVGYYICGVRPGTTVDEFFAMLGRGDELTSSMGEPKSGDEAVVTYDHVNIGNREFLVIVLGDIDCDGATTAADAAHILRSLVEVEWADDLMITAGALSDSNRRSLQAADASHILRWLVGLEDELWIR